MKLATALSERSDLQRRIAELEGRLENNAKVQEGDVPSEDPRALLAELNDCTARLEELIARINLTNSAVRAEGKTMTELLAHRDCLKQKIRVMRKFLDAASQKIDRYSNKEIKILSTLPVSEIQKDVDALSKELRLTDEAIQELNWTSELQ